MTKSVFSSMNPRKLDHDNSTYSLRDAGREAGEGCSLLVRVQYLWQRHLKVSELMEMARSGYARETYVFVTLINAWGDQLKRKKDFFCFMISEVLLDGLSSIAFGPVVRHYNIAGVYVEKACLPHGIQGKRGGQGPNIPISHSRICPYWPYFFYLNFTTSSKLPSPPRTSHNTTGW